MAQPVAGCGLLFDDLFQADFLSDVVCDHEWTAGLPLHSAEESNLQVREAGVRLLKDYSLAALPSRSTSELCRFQHARACWLTLDWQQERHDQPTGNLILEDDCQLDLMLDAVCDIEGNRLFDQHDDGLPSQPMPATTKRDTEWPLLQYSGQPTQPVKVRQAGK